MASIELRKRQDGTKAWRVRFRKNGFRPLVVSFSNKKQAEDWVIEHEDLFYEDPEKYYTWLKNMLAVSKKVDNRGPWIEKIKVRRKEKK